MAKVGAARTIYQMFTSHSGGCGFCESVENQFLEGLTSLWPALARRLFSGSLAFLSACAAKNREPTHHPKHSENALTTNQKLDTLTSVLNPQGLEPSHVSG